MMPIWKNYQFKGTIPAFKLGQKNDVITPQTFFMRPPFFSLFILVEKYSVPCITKRFGCRNNDRLWNINTFENTHVQLVNGILIFGQRIILFAKKNYSYNNYFFPNNTLIYLVFPVYIYNLKNIFTHNLNILIDCGTSYGNWHSVF